MLTNATDHGAISSCCENVVASLGRFFCMFLTNNMQCLSKVRDHRTSNTFLRIFSSEISIGLINSVTPFSFQLLCKLLLSFLSFLFNSRNIALGKVPLKFHFQDFLVRYLAVFYPTFFQKY